MPDLIKQIEHAAAGSLTDEVRLLKQKRKTLDDVIRFTLGISHLQKSLEAVLLLKQPASSIPRELLNILGNISQKVASLPSNELEKRLERIEETIKQDIDTIMGISDQVEMLDPGSHKEVTTQVNPDECHSLVSDFRRRTNTAIILKLHLRKRGVSVKESIIPVTTDALVSQVSRLVNEEKKCTQRTIKQLTELDLEIGKIIGHENYNIDIKKYALLMKLQISKNIDHLKQGKDIEKMPFAIEIIELVSNDEKTEPSKESEINTPVPPNEITGNEPTGKDSTDPVIKISLAKKLMKWLSSPLSTKWRDIK